MPPTLRVRRLNYPIQEMGLEPCWTQWSLSEWPACELGKVGMTGEEVSEGFSAELRKPSRSWQKTKRWGQQVSPLALLTQPLEAWAGVMALEAGGCDAHAGSPSLPRSRSKLSLPCLFPGSLLKLRFHTKRGAFNESGCKPLPVHGKRVYQSFSGTLHRLALGRFQDIPQL